MNIINEEHKELTDCIINNKSSIIPILSLHIDLGITDYECIFEYYINCRRVDCIILCNSGHIILLETKPAPDSNGLRIAISQLNDYKQLLKNRPFKNILSDFEEKPILKQFIDTNKITETLIAERYNKINDYHTITFVANMKNTLLNNYKEQIISQNLYNNFLIILNRNNEHTDSIHTYCIEYNQISTTGKSIGNLFKETINECMNQFNRLPVINEINADTILLVSLIKAIYDKIIEIEEQFSLNISNDKKVKEVEYLKSLNANDENKELRELLINEFKKRGLTINEFIRYVKNSKSFPPLAEIYKIFGTRSFRKVFIDGGYDIKEIKNEDSKLEIVYELQKVYEKHKIISTKVLQDERICGKVINNFGSIENACLEAKIPYTKNKRGMAKQDIIDLMFNIIIPEFTRKNIPFTQKSLSSYGIKDYILRKHFGSMKEFKAFFRI